MGDRIARRSPFVSGLPSAPRGDPSASAPTGQPAARPGLTTERAAAILEAAGPNRLEREATTPWWRLLLRQFSSLVIVLLLVACGVALALGELADGIAILSIVILNGIIGFVQERSAQNAVLALRSMTSPLARVRRDGLAVDVPAAEVVPGDVLELQAGDLVAADATLLEVHGLTVNQASLTGESEPVAKDATPLPGDVPLAERRDRVHAGTSVSAGTGTAEVFATGMNTQLGHIAHLLATTADEATPLQVQLAAVSRTLVKLCVVIVALVAVVGFLRGLPWLEIVLSSVSLAVAAVPEGLPAIVTVALAVGIRRMAARKVLVRHLPAVETLGAATVICTDKTGTLTTGKMVVREIWGDDERAVMFAAAANCDAELATNTGDPTELALLAGARERGIERGAVERDLPRVAVNPFDASRKRMSILRSDGVLYVKGAPDSVLPLCVDGDTSPAVTANAELAARGLRVLAVATGRGDCEERLSLLAQKVRESRTFVVRVLDKKEVPA